MMLSMYVYDKDYPEYKAPFDINELSPQKTTHQQRDFDDPKSVISELRQQVSELQALVGKKRPAGLFSDYTSAETKHQKLVHPQLIIKTD